MTEAQRHAWREGGEGFTVYDGSLTIIDSSTPGMVGVNAADMPLFFDTYWGEFEHVRRNPDSQLTTRKLHNGRVWQMTFGSVDDHIVVDWKVLYVVPADAADSMSRMLSVVRSACAALEEPAADAPAVPPKTAARRSRCVPALRAV